MIYPKLFSVVLSVALASAEHLGHAARSHHLSKRVDVSRSEAWKSGSQMPDSLSTRPVSGLVENITIQAISSLP